MTGLSLGFWVHGPDDRSAVLGVEASYARVYESFLGVGAYADLRYDQRARGVQLGLGGQVQWLILVADAGLVVRVGAASSVGFRARGCISLAAIAVCGGGGLTTEGSFIEGTLLLKFPRELGQRDRAQ